MSKVIDVIRRPARNIRGALVVLSWVAAVSVLWLPGCGAVMIACRPSAFTERRFGFFGYYWTRFGRNGAYLEAVDHQGLLVTVAASVVISVVCAWQYERVTSHRIEPRPPRHFR